MAINNRNRIDPLSYDGIDKQLKRIKKDWRSILGKMRLSMDDISSYIGVNKTFLYYGYKSEQKNKELEYRLKQTTVKQLSDHIVKKRIEKINNKYDI